MSHVQVLLPQLLVTNSLTLMSPAQELLIQLLIANSVTNTHVTCTGANRGADSSHDARNARNVSRTVFQIFVFLLVLWIAVSY